MRDAGATPVTRALDVSDESAVAALVREIGETMPRLGGVLHAAATFDDGFLLQLDAERLTGVMAAKAYGAWNLHRQTAAMELDFFVLFSSVSSVVGSPGQANYVAANAFLDALAQHRRRRGVCFRQARATVHDLRAAFHEHERRLGAGVLQ
jgi:NADP-dependent 3-hydroxy acid dehydrogenase YdfG